VRHIDLARPRALTRQLDRFRHANDTSHSGAVTAIVRDRYGQAALFACATRASVRIWLQDR
jgi:hypothetical protein